MPVKRGASGAGAAGAVAALPGGTYFAASRFGRRVAAVWATGGPQLPHTMTQTVTNVGKS